MNSLRRARLLSAGLLAAVFVTGVLVGAATDRALGGGSHEHHTRRYGIDAEVLERMHLDARQQAEVDRILERRRIEAAAVWNEVKPRFNQVVADTRSDLSHVLTPAQLGEYDRWIAERSRRMEKRFEPSGRKTS